MSKQVVKSPQIKESGATASSVTKKRPQAPRKSQSPDKKVGRNQRPVSAQKKCKPGEKRNGNSKAVGSSTKGNGSKRHVRPEEDVDEFFIDDNIPRFLGDASSDHSGLQLVGDLTDVMSDFVYVPDDLVGCQPPLDDHVVDQLAGDDQSPYLMNQSTMTDSQCTHCSCGRPPTKDVGLDVIEPAESDMEVDKEVMDVAAEMPENKENIISRVAGLPVVNSAIGQVSNIYTKTKEYNGLLKYTFEVAEKSVGTVANTAQPVVNKFEKQITYANDFACNQMDKLEEACPAITLPPEKIYSNVVDGTKRVWDGTKAVGFQTVDSVAKTRVGQAVCAGVDVSLALSEMVVDRCLPPDDQEREENAAKVEEEKTDQEKEEMSWTSVDRVVSLSGKVRQRVYKRAMTKLQTAQRRSQETVEKLHYTVDLIAYARSNIDSTNQKVKEKVSDAQEKLWSTWNEWTTEAEEGEEAVAEEEAVESSDNKTVAVARNLAKRLKVACGKVVASGAQVLPESVVLQATKAKEMADEVYESFKNAKVLNDMPANLLNQAQEKLNSVSEAMVSLTDYVVSSSAVQWMVGRVAKEENIIMQDLETSPPSSDENVAELDVNASPAAVLEEFDSKCDSDSDGVDIDDEFHSDDYGFKKLE